MSAEAKGIKLNRKTNTDQHLTFHDGDLPYFSFPHFDALGVKNGFTTKLGGVSEDCFAELNMAALKERPEIIRENYRRVCETLHMDSGKVVLSYQTHTTGIRLITEEDFGKGPFRDRDYVDTDGLITDIPGAVLVTLYADCVPLYFYDPVHKAIGLSHSGWRGTVNRMGACTLKRMAEAFGTRPEDVYAGIGPGICGSCYEISEDVAVQFRDEFGSENFDLIAVRENDTHFFLDLWKTNQTVLKEAGILPAHLFTTDICTRCNSDLLYSHRVMGNRRGTLAALLSL